MKILMEINGFREGQKSGINNFLFSLCCALLAQTKDEKFTFWGPDVEHDPFPEFPNKKLRIRRVLSRSTLEELWLSTKVGAIPADIDIYHLPFIMKPAPRRATRTRLVVTMYDVIVATYPETFPNPASMSPFIESLSAQAGQADKIITISQSAKCDIETIFGLPSERVTVIYPGTDLQSPTDLEGEMARLRAELSLPHRYFLHFSSWQRRKNVSGIIRAFEKVVAHYREQEIFLCLGGGSEVLPEDEYLFRNAPCRDRIIFLNHVRREWMPVLYAGALGFVFPSFYEGFGLPVLEAMSCGTPVITSNVSSLPEVVGDAAIMVNPVDIDALAEAMLQLCHNDILCQALKQKGLVQAKKFSWDEAARQTLQTYHSLITSG